MNGAYFSGNCSYLLGFTSWDCGVNISDQSTLTLGILQIAVNVLADLSVAVAYLVLGYVIYGGYRYIFSGGDPDKVASGKKTLAHAFIGLAIAMSANLIMNTIRLVLLGQSGKFDNCATHQCVDAGTLVSGTIQWFIAMAGIVSVIFVVYGGISYITSSGDPTKLKKAKDSILYALVGLIIVALAETITIFVSDKILDASGEGSSAITISSGNNQIKEGESTQIRIASPSATPPTAFTYQSSNQDIAAVDSTGKVTANSPGSTTISVYDRSNGGMVGELNITVIPIIRVSSVKISSNQLKLETGTTKTLSVSILPKDAEDKSVVFSSSNSSIVAVSNDGRVTAKKPGTATITVTSSNGKTAKCTVIVKNKADNLITGGEAIAQAATKLAVSGERLKVEWPSTKSNDQRAKLFNKARESVGIGTHDVAGEKGYFYASCDVGVATAVRYSGVDKNFAWNGIPNIWPYLRKSGKWKQAGTFRRGTDKASQLKPGDVLISGEPYGHIFIYIGNRIVKLKYPNSAADSMEAGYSSERGQSYYPHLFNVTTEQRNRITYTIFRHVNYNKKQYKKIL